MKWWHYFSRPLVGLDIYQDALCLMQVPWRKQQGMTVRHCPLPPTIFADGKIKDWDGLHAVLAAEVAGLGLKGMTAAIQLPAHLVRMQKRVLPFGLSSLAIESEIHRQLQRDLPGMSEALAIDFNELPQENDDEVAVLFFAARFAYVAQYVACVRKAGLNVKIVDVDLFALLRVVAFLLPAALQRFRARAVLYVRQSMAMMIINNAHDIPFYQQWKLTEVADFPQQVKSTLQWWRANFQVAVIDQLILCGEHPYLTDNLPQCADLATEVYDLNKQLFTDDVADFLIAYGLALRVTPTW